MLNKGYCLVIGTRLENRNRNLRRSILFIVFLTLITIFFLSFGKCARA